MIAKRRDVRISNVLRVLGAETQIGKGGGKAAVCFEGGVCICKRQEKPKNNDSWFVAHDGRRVV